ncbi:acetyl-CoA synthetase-like protein [Wolfiporia cocos MD-104 SS10]|uniref:Acetyl-CoA synthetase-like protein n=1 Tax=Wolfiporia cocos (strain MD-104) TaxID=742152 RepID=A0A2H3JLQ8_WOLCO|nr:acetyl-CoA synthetase-like protein [Wolfiporia cocos MD-104 SS10]
MPDISSSILPPLDGSIHVFPGLVDFHAEHNPNLPMFIFPATEPSGISQVTYREFSDATHRIAHLVRPLSGEPAIGDNSVVAILSNTDHVLYHALVAGTARAGLIPFPMAQRNSAPAIANLLTRTACNTIISQPEYASLLSDVRSVLPSGHALRVLAVPALAGVFPAFSASPSAVARKLIPYPALRRAQAADAPALYLHSSGSTGFPKPIPQTRRTLLQWCATDSLRLSRAHGYTWGSPALPPFHTLGLTGQLLIALISGRPSALFAPRTHRGEALGVPTPEGTLEVVRAAGVDVLLCVPSFLEAWAQDEESVRFLATLPAVTYSGGPISPATGDKLVAAGVLLYPIYGGTEFGGATRTFHHTRANGAHQASDPAGTRDWEYVEFSEHVSPRLVPQGDGTYELWLMNCATHQPSVENLTNGERGYATSDLFARHPTNPALWKIVGRLDEVIVLSTGEKIVPIQQQGIIGAHPLVNAAVMFGRGREHVGVLVEPRPPHTVPQGDDRALAAFRNAIWAQVEEANAIAPAFGRIFKEMILVADPARPFPRAAKGTVIVKQTLKAYEADIDAVYSTVAGSSDGQGVPPPVAWTVPAVREWLVETGASIGGGKAPDVHEDLFQQGYDSLSATFLRNRIIGALRASTDPAAKAAARDVRPNFVFAHPTLAALASAIVGLVNPDAASDPTSSPTEQIEAMIAKYAALIPRRSAGASGQRNGVDPKAVVLLTGSTGVLGSHVLARLLADASVARVYALNRGESLRARQRDAFDAAQLPVDLLSSDKLVLASGNITRESEDLGVEQSVLAEMQSTVTHVVHNAWRVDFAIALASFEPHIRAAARLVALFPNARFLFMSSMSTAQGWSIAERGRVVPEEPLHEPALAVGTGYGMSKFVVEEILSCARERGITTTTLRVGQISGSSSNGAWNTSEWVPSLVKSSRALGCLPDMDGLVSWLPMEAVAQTTLDVLKCASPPALVNVVHPHPVSAKVIFDAFSEELGSASAPLARVSMSDWVDRLDAASKDEKNLATVPAILLLDFFRGMGALASTTNADAHKVEMGGLPLYDTTKVCSISASMRDLTSLGPQDVHKWIEYWRKGFIRN